MASPGNEHCANCIGTLSFPIGKATVPSGPRFSSVPLAAVAECDIGTVCDPWTKSPADLQRGIGAASAEISGKRCGA